MTLQVVKNLIQTAQDASGTTFAWQAVPYASLYRIYVNGIRLRDVTGLTTKVLENPGTYTLGVQPLSGAPPAPTHRDFTVASPTGPPINSQSDIVGGTTSYYGGNCTTALNFPAGTTWASGILNAPSVSTAKQLGVATVNSNCTLIDCTMIAGGNAWTTLRIHDGSTNVVIKGGRYSGAGALGIGGAGNVTLTGTEISGNGVNAHGTGWGQVPFDWEAGGVKISSVASTLHLTNCKLLNNLGGPGAWTDINVRDFLVDTCTISDNELSGVMYEDSGGCGVVVPGLVCRNNSFAGNGYGKLNWFWGSAVLIAASDTADVYGNTIQTAHGTSGAHGNGITVVQQSYQGNTTLGRADNPPPGGFPDADGVLFHSCHSIHVHGNTISGAGQSGGVSQVGVGWILFGAAQSTRYNLADAAHKIAFDSDNVYNSPHVNAGLSNT